ncbi:L,D-transpeptidase family protein [Longimicrobium sp.]|uniref:L,D-transpeptidase family protein n=1 Tax=Longimicrobium sp. TaxID=2029185 RepID=UPI002E350459|nr:L,D-transpeptidase family protein [Longimicrobium sp.]HEX6040614.1 L,D-transpeptidase family protein [Longimicrobium sp.]
MKRKTFAIAAALLVLLFGGVLAWANHPDAPPLPSDARADLVRVDKGARTLTLLRDGRPLKTYRVSLGGAPRGHKRQEGDERTPEGRYLLDYRNPHSFAHLSLHVSYPDSSDQARARAAGVPPGGMIMVHGLRDGLGWMGRLHRLVDWTDGCIAVTNAEMDEIWRAVPDGTPIEIRP